MVEQIQAMIRISGYEATSDDLILAEVFAASEGHLPLSMLRHLFREATGRDVSIRRIKRFMDFLCEYGAAEKKDFPDGARYEHRHIGEHHDHLICSKCSRVVEFERDDLEELQEKIAGAFGFTLYRHVMDLFGICDACRELDQVQMGFTDLPEGDAIVVSRIEGGSGTRRHLADLGVKEGTSVTLLRKKPTPVIATGEGRYAMGMGLAEKIYGYPAEVVV